MVALWHISTHSNQPASLDDHLPLRKGPGCEDGWRTYPGSSYTYNHENRRL